MACAGALLVAGIARACRNVGARHVGGVAVGSHAGSRSAGLCVVMGLLGAVPGRESARRDWLARLCPAPSDRTPRTGAGEPSPGIGLGALACTDVLVGRKP